MKKHIDVGASSETALKSDGNVRVFSGGRLMLRLDPDIAHGPIHMGE